MRYYREDIDTIFAGQTPLREKTRELANLICDEVKICDERDFAIGKLRECVVWAEAGRLKNEQLETDD